ncbi:class A sortase [Carnobacterium divergens]|uniref:Class A sortase n=1 Tax=Carnobacterium divergens TaxID=2748 RepID=A0AAW8R948_CARDV|nr:class A sortase [Carnobacterium divergens]MDT1956883.1 class A sortase [Carnobacterium divergens]MDT1972853.1 class A sortase [Carnobacterium divergens]
MSSQKKKNQKIKDYLQLTSIVLAIGIGLCFIFTPWLKNELIASYSNHYLTKEYKQNEWITNATKPATFDYESIQPPNLKEIAFQSIKPKPELIIGKLTIESLNMNLPIFKGTTNQNLLSGVGTMTEQQELGVGNYALAGHHLYDETLLFGPLLKIKEGALIQLTNQSELYTYKVLNSKIVHQSELSILANQGDNRLTLVTCDVPFQTDQRWIVTAILVHQDNLVKKEKETALSESVKAYQEVEKQFINQQKRSAFKQNNWLIFLCLFLLLLTVLILVKRCGKKSRSNENK